MKGSATTLAISATLLLSLSLGFGQTDQGKIFPDKITFRQDDKELITRNAQESPLPKDAVKKATSALNDDEITELPNYTVEETKLPELTFRRENVVQAFFRTGTIAQHVGKKITTRFWAKGDEGLMLSFSR